MAALTASRDTKTRNTKNKISVPLKAGAKVYAGGLVAVDATGYGVDAVASATNYQLIVLATADVDNTAGVSGALSVDCYECDAYLANSSIAACDQTCLGVLVYCENDQTAAKTTETATLSALGHCVGFDSGGVWVRVCVGAVT